MYFWTDIAPRVTHSIKKHVFFHHHENCLNIRWMISNLYKSGINLPVVQCEKFISLCALLKIFFFFFYKPIQMASVQEKSGEKTGNIEWIKELSDQTGVLHCSTDLFRIMQVFHSDPTESMKTSLVVLVPLCSLHQPSWAPLSCAAHCRLPSMAFTRSVPLKTFFFFF